MVEAGTSLCARLYDGCNQGTGWDRARASGVPTVGIWAVPATCRTIRSMRTTSASCRWPGDSRPMCSGFGRTTTFRTTPLMINGVLYATVGTRRDAVAIDAATGELLWMYRLDEGKRAAAAPRLLSGRNVAYWTDGRGDERIFMVTIGYQLVALNARTGVPVQSFGQNGVLDLKQNNDQVLDPITGEIGLNTGPVVAKDVVIVGAAHRAGNAPRSRTNAKGLHSRVRRQDRQAAVDLPHHSAARRVWQRDLGERLVVVLRQCGCVGSIFGGRRAETRCTCRLSSQRAIISVDTGRGTTSSPSRSWRWTCTRGSANGTSSSSITASGTSTCRARRFWPTLRSTADASRLSAVPSKQGFLYVFDRQTGEPVWPIAGTPRRKRNGSGRMVFADAAVSNQAPAVRASGRSGKRPD